MKTNYQTPQIEVIELELEGVLCASGDASDEEHTFGATLPGVTLGGN